MQRPTESTVSSNNTENIADGIASYSPGTLALRLNKINIQAREYHTLGSDSEVIKFVDQLPSHCGPSSEKNLRGEFPSIVLYSASFDAHTAENPP